MAIEVTTLNFERLRAGYELLRKTDALSFNAIGAGWYQSSHEGRWRFFLVTPMIDSKGPKWVYSRLLAALRVMKIPPGIKPLEIHLVSPREERFYNLHKKLNIPDLPEPREFKERNLFHAHRDDTNRLGIHAIIIYRMKGMDRHARNTARKFDRKVRELRAVW